MGMGSPQLTALERLLTSRAVANDPEVKVAVTRLHSEINERIKTATPSSIEFLLSSARALSKLRGLANSELRLKCLAELSLFLITQGHTRDAVPAIEAVRSLARQSHKRIWIRRGDLLAGAANGELGNIAEAVVCYSRAWETARELHDEAGQLSLLNNLGVALNYGALYREAIPYFELGLAMAQSETAEAACRAWGTPRNEYECMVLNNLAQSHLYLQDFDRGFVVISECLRRSSEPRDAKSAIGRLSREHTFVQLALELGRLTDARIHTEMCRKYAMFAARQRRYLADVCVGLCEVYGGDSKRGIKLLEGALDTVTNAGMTSAPVLIPLIKACEEAQRPELALEYMNRLVEDISATRAANISALLSCSMGAEGAGKIAIDDLQPLKMVAARLRTTIAERRVSSAHIETLERLAVTADLKEEQSGEHGYRVGRLSFLIAEGLNWAADNCRGIESAARLHDIGKVGIPERILLKTQQLRDAEREIMSIHTVIGAELLAKSDIPQLRMAEDIARFHHEWWDGTGYPAKLGGKRIPIHARIVALADVFDALTHGRPYAPAWPIDKALEEIQAKRGMQFDPDLTDRFIGLVRRLQMEYRDPDEYLGRAGRNSPFAQARSRIRLMLEEGRERVEKENSPALHTLH